MTIHGAVGSIVPVELAGKLIVSVATVFVLGFTLTPEMGTAGALLVGALFLGLVNLYNAKTARLVAMKEVARAIAPIVTKVDETAKVVGEMAPVLDKVNVHVNSEKDRATAEREKLNLQIELQQEMIEELKKAASLLAAARASAELVKAVADAAVAGATTPASAAPTPSPSMEQHAKETAVNTAETATNTKRTDAAVQDLKDEKGS